MKKEIEWRIFLYNDLSIDVLYDILHLRCKVFVVEQDAPYLDLDYKDQKAIHQCGYVDGRLVAYCRLFKAGDYFDEASIGRVIVDKNYRRFGYGHDLMDKAIELERDLIGEGCIIISAQLYLQQFYGCHGFEKVSDVYLEDGLPHIRMKRYAH